MDTSQLAGSVLMIGFAGTRLPSEVADAIGRQQLAGVILFRRNVESHTQVFALTHACQRALPEDAPPLLVGVDQEGGRVARIDEPVVALPPMRVLGEIDDVKLTEEAGVVLGAQLRALGFNLDFAPVVDVDTNPDNPVIGDRSFGSDARQVARHAAAFAQGLHHGGVASCAKHFPGHGDTELDSHLALPALDHDRERLNQVELLPFTETIPIVPAIMTAHIVFRSLDPDRPATLSERVVRDLLKDELGFDGVVVSDDLEMRAVADRWSAGDAAVAAIEAGCDLLLICSRWEAYQEARQALADKAQRSAGFHRRLQDAAKRVHVLRSRVFPAAEDAEMLNAQARALETKIAHSMRQAGTKGKSTT